jgi:hypothetical protein
MYQYRLPCTAIRIYQVYRHGSTGLGFQMLDRYNLNNRK